MIGSLPKGLEREIFSMAVNSKIRHLDSIACSRLSDNGEDAKVKGVRKVGGAGNRKKEVFPVSSSFIFVLALFQFS